MENTAVSFAEELFLLLRRHSQPSKEILAAMAKTPPPPGIAQTLLSGTHIGIPMQM